MERTMQVNAYLSFNGQCEEAFKFYEKCLGGKITGIFTHAGTPAAEHVPSDWLNKIMHAHLAVGDGVLMGSDAPPGRYEPAKGFSVMLRVKDPADAERIFHELSENGSVRTPLQPTFWTVRFGMLVDRFGIPWMVNCEQPA